MFKTEPSEMYYFNKKKKLLNVFNNDHSDSASLASDFSGWKDFWIRNRQILKFELLIGHVAGFIPGKLQVKTEIINGLHCYDPDRKIVFVINHFHVILWGKVILFPGQITPKIISD